MNTEQVHQTGDRFQIEQGEKEYPGFTVHVWYVRDIQTGKHIGYVYRRQGDAQATADILNRSSLEDEA